MIFNLYLTPKINMLSNVIRTTWPLFLGILFIGLGNGLQGTLSSWRADFEGFSVLTTGLIMSGYFIGRISQFYFVT